MDLDDKTHIEVIRSKRKTLAIEIRPDMRVVVEMPLRKYLKMKS